MIYPFKAIICVTVKERDKKTGRDRLVVSHGVYADSGVHVTLPNETPEDIGAIWRPDLNEWVLRG